jgi:hypothetical protein
LGVSRFFSSSTLTSEEGRCASLVLSGVKQFHLMGNQPLYTLLGFVGFFFLLFFPTLLSQLLLWTHFVAEMES